MVDLRRRQLDGRPRLEFVRHSHGRPRREGAYRVGIWARDATMKADVGTTSESVLQKQRNGSMPPPVTAPSAPVSSPTPISGPLVVAGLTSSVGSPRRRDEHHVLRPDWRPRAVSFRWFFFDGKAGRSRVTGALPDIVWRPPDHGAPRIGIGVRDATSPTGASPAGWSVPFRID